MNLKEAKELYIKAKNAYYNTGHPIISDAQFDKLEDWITKKDPSWIELKKTGISVVGKKQEVKLPFFMPSLNKFYPEEVSKLWAKLPQEDTYIYMAKLDGCSVLLEYKEGKPFSLITRGNGELGKDISFLISYLNLKMIEDKEYHAFRCEAILAKHLFVKWQKEFDNARNMVSGLLNRRQPHSAFADISFVVLGEYSKTLEQGLIFAAKQGLDVVYYKKSIANQEEKYFNQFKLGLFETDGVVISTPDFEYSYSSSEKPKSGIFAYKINATEDKVQATVNKVIWQISAFGRLIPKIKINPVIAQGAKITYVTCHNAKWLEDHGIGPGAVVEIIRSGEVIPKVVGVVKPAEHLQLPDIPYYKNGVHFYQKAATEESYINSLLRCLNIFEIDLVKEKSIQRIYHIYYTKYFVNTQPIDGLIALLTNEKTLLQSFKAEFGNKLGSSIYENLNKVIDEQHTIIDWLLATMAFDAGIGRKRLLAVNKIQSLESMKSWSKDAILARLFSIKSIGPVLAEQITEGLLKFYQWYARQETWLKFKPLSEQKLIAGPMSSVNVTFTGYRDANQEKAILSLGGNIIAFSAKTTWLLYKSDGKRSTKVAKAGSKAITWDDLVKKYPALEKAFSLNTISLF